MCRSDSNWTSDVPLFDLSSSKEKRLECKYFIHFYSVRPELHSITCALNFWKHNPYIPWRTNLIQIDAWASMGKIFRDEWALFRWKLNQYERDVVAFISALSIYFVIKNCDTVMICVWEYEATQTKHKLYTWYTNYLCFL